MSFSNSVFLSNYLFTLAITCLQSCSALLNITAQPGENITLPCQAPSNKLHIAVEWTRPDLTPDLVFFYMDGYTKEKLQHSSFRGRVDLVDRKMKDRNLSLFLYNVTANDNGTYECRVKVNDGRRRIRGVVDSPPIATIKLMVTPQSGDTDESKGGGNKDGHVVLIAGLPAALFVLVFIGAMGFGIYRGSTKDNSYQHPPEQPGHKPIKDEVTRKEETFIG